MQLWSFEQKLSKLLGQVICQHALSIGKPIDWQSKTAELHFVPAVFYFLFMNGFL